MATNLTEVSEYTATVTAPDGGDSRSNAANVVAALAQALMNRTRWLKDIVTRTNTWLAQQAFDVGLNPDTPMVVSVKTPLDCNVTGTPEPTNPWRMFAELPTGLPDINVRLYWGPTAGHFAVTYNAYWRPQNQKWRQEDAASASFGLILGGDSLSMGRKAAATPDWDNGAWDVHGDVYVNTVYADQFRFTDGYVARKRQLALSSAVGPVSPVALRTNNRIQFDETLDATAVSKGIRWPVPLLPNNTIGTITVIFNITNAGDTFQWYRRRQNPDHSTSYSSVGVPVTTDGINMAWATIPEPSGIQDGDEYELIWKLQNSSDAAQVNGNIVYALQSAWDQYGPMGGGW